MPIKRDNPFACDYVGCTALRRSVNHWFRVTVDETGVRIWHWDSLPVGMEENAAQFCGHDHAMRYASSMLLPQRVDPDKKSTLELKPPLTREGTPSENKET